MNCGIHEGTSTHVCGPICPPCQRCAERTRMRVEGGRFTIYKPSAEAQAHLDRLAERRKL